MNFKERIRRYFFAGLLVLLPLVITVWLLGWIIGLMDGLLKYGTFALVAWVVVSAFGIWYQWRDLAGDYNRIAIDRTSYQVS